MDIELKNVTKRYGEKTVLENLNMTFKEGRITCLMGASGVGKTTVVNLLLNLIKQDNGEIAGLEGRSASAVFQEDRLIEHWNAVRNIRLVCAKEVTEVRAVYELSKLGLSGERNKPVREYSGGMRRRVVIIRALLAKSDLIILDEPFRGIDITMKKQVIEYIKNNTVGKTVIVVTHDKEDAQLLEADILSLT